MAKKKKVQQPSVNKELKGFSIGIDAFGEVSSNYSIEAINTFLNRNVPDKKLEQEENSPSEAKKDIAKPHRAS